MFKKRENSDEQGSDEYYSLMFDQAGGTYTLNQVYRHYGDTSQDGVPVVNGLNSFKKTISKVVTNGTGTDELGENGSEKLGFWPMDAASTWGAEGHDLKFGAGSTPGEYKVSDKNKYYGLTSSDQITTPGKLKSDGEKLERGLKNFPIGDDAYDHNSYFGMTFHEDFILEPGYCAPLRYFFYGDDDMFVYLTDITNAYEYDSEKREDVPKQNYDSIVSAALDDSNMTKKISGVGGVHSSAGMYTDLWSFLKPLSTEESASRNEGKAKSNHYRLSVYYDERGESGSTCYMRYTLPLKPVKTAERDYEGNLKIEKNVLSGNSENQSDSYNFKVKLFNFGSTGDDYSLVNKYNYEIYQKGEEGFPDSLIQNGQMQSYNDSLDQPAANTPESDENQNNQVINGSFDLEDNQYVLIKRLINGTRYQVTETNAGKMTTYAVGTIDEGIQSATSPIGSESVSGSVDAEAGDVENADKNYVVFYNADNPGRLSIQKKLNEEITDQNRGQVFSFRVKLTDQNGSKLPGKVGYTVSKTDSGTSKSQPEKSAASDESGDDQSDDPEPDPNGSVKQEPTAFNELNLNEKYEGEITIKAGETATIINLPEGTKYEVEEILNSNGEYSFESVEVENGIEQNFEKDGAKVTGTINNTAADAPALTLVFTNRIGQPSLALVKKQAIITEETTPDFDSANADNEPPMKVGYGDRVRYFLQVTNTGDQAQTQVVIKDEIPVKPVSGDTRAQSYIAGSAGSVDSGIQIDEGSDCIV